MGRQRGFTLIELMITVAILGILSAIAIPAFSGFIKRSKTAEATTNLNSLFKSTASYYDSGRAGAGISSSTSSHCSVATALPVPTTPGKQKVKFVPPAGSSFYALGFTIGDYVYYSYGITSQSPGCGKAAGTPDIYTLYANGDLDGDSQESVFELAVGSDSDNGLYHARAIYITEEME